jgi:hypothetical protein
MRETMCRFDEVHEIATHSSLPLHRLIQSILQLWPCKYKQTVSVSDFLCLSHLVIDDKVITFLLKKTSVQNSIRNGKFIEMCVILL